MVNKRDLSKELRNALMEVKESMEGKKKLLTWEELELQDAGLLTQRVEENIQAEETNANAY
jgi:hypothetical protein